MFELDWVIDLAKEAGEIALSYFRRTSITWKADKTIVTEADRAVESFLTSELRQRYPDDGILGEEGASHQRQARRQWVLDPIDGTSVFAHGLPIWGICIGLMVEDRPVAGVVSVPAVGDCYAAGIDGPALLNGEPIQVRARRTLSQRQRHLRLRRRAPALDVRLSRQSALIRFLRRAFLLCGCRQRDRGYQFQDCLVGCGRGSADSGTRRRALHSFGRLATARGQQHGRSKIPAAHRPGSCRPSQRPPLAHFSSLTPDL